MRAISYVRVSTKEQGESGAGLAAQRATIEAACTARGWELVAIEQDIASGSRTNGRHGLKRALTALENGDADVLVVAKLDRLSRSLIDFANLVERSRKQGWTVVALDVGVDLTTPHGELIATILSALAQWERRLIGQRTKEALAEKRAAGVRLGRPRSMPATVRARIVRARKRGQTFRAIADALNADGVPTAQGGAAWHPSTVRWAVRATCA